MVLNLGVFSIYVSYPEGGSGVAYSLKYQFHCKQSANYKRWTSNIQVGNCINECWHVTIQRAPPGIHRTEPSAQHTDTHTHPLTAKLLNVFSWSIRFTPIRLVALCRVVVVFVFWFVQLFCTFPTNWFLINIRILVFPSKCRNIFVSPVTNSMPQCFRTYK